MWGSQGGIGFDRLGWDEYNGGPNCPHQHIYVLISIYSRLELISKFVRSHYFHHYGLSYIIVVTKASPFPSRSKENYIISFCWFSGMFSSC